MNQATTCAMISGRPANFAVGGIATPSFFGHTTIRVTDGRLTETTKTLFGERNRQILLAEVDSTEVVERWEPALLVFGLCTLPLLFFGLIPIAASYLLRGRILVIHSRTHVVAVRVKGDSKPYCQFMDTVLKMAEDVRQYSRPRPNH